MQPLPAPGRRSKLAVFSPKCFLCWGVIRNVVFGGFCESSYACCRKLLILQVCFWICFLVFFINGSPHLGAGGTSGWLASPGRRTISAECLRPGSWLMGHLLAFAKSFKSSWAPSNPGQERPWNFVALWYKETIFHQTLFLRKYVWKQPRKLGEQLSLLVSSLLLVGSRNGWVNFTSGFLMSCLPYCVSS